jgi:hypothetical protein
MIVVKSEEKSTNGGVTASVLLSGIGEMFSIFFLKDVFIYFCLKIGGLLVFVENFPTH